MVDVTLKDKEIYYQIKKATCEKFVNKYWGGWDDTWQKQYNDRIFEESLAQDCFKIINFSDKIVGFFGYSIGEKEISCVTLQVLNIENRKEVFKFALGELVKVANNLRLPIYVKSFLGSKDIAMYKEFGFEIIGETYSHYLIKKGV